MGRFAAFAFAHHGRPALCYNTRDVRPYLVPLTPPPPPPRAPSPGADGDDQLVGEQGQVLQGKQVGDSPITQRMQVFRRHCGYRQEPRHGCKD